MRYAAFLLLLAASQLDAQGAVSALERAEQTYNSIETLTAEFRQTIVNPMLGAPEVSRGTIYLVPPSRFAMRFSDPPSDRIVADGTWLWAYSPEAVPGQVIRQPIPKLGAASPNLLAQFVDRPLEHYRAGYVGEEILGEDTVDVVRLLPRTADLPFRQAEIAIARETGLVLRVAVRELSGQRRTLEFDRIRLNESVPEAELRFDVPEGVRVVTP